jgi:hypothetical protein
MIFLYLTKQKLGQERLQIEEFETKTGLHCDLSYTNKTSVSNRNIKIGIGFITTFGHSGIQKSTRKKKKIRSSVKLSVSNDRVRCLFEVLPTAHINVFLDARDCCFFRVECQAFITRNISYSFPSIGYLFRQTNL